MTSSRWAGDGLLAGALLLFALVATPLATAHQPGAVPLDAPGYALIAVAGTVLAVRGRWPVGTLVVSTAAITGYLFRGYAYGPVLLVFTVAVFTVAARLRARSAAALAAAALLALSAHALVPHPNSPGPAGLLPATAWVVVPYALGVTARLNREAAARARADTGRRIADEERLRIAQEVHDVVGHGLAAITLQAEVALHLLHRRPEQAEVALAAISRTSRQGLDELRATLLAVRQDRAPAPGLAQLPALRDRLAHAGLPVTLSIVDGAELPAAVDLAGYRIVQEALTNVLRHAAASSARVRVEHRPGAVELEVTDTGVGGSPSPGGTGIAGMRERAGALGGTLTAGPATGGGFRVHAVLPVRGS